MDRQQEFVLRTVEERDIRFIRLWFTDVLGTLKSVAVAPAELEAAFSEGIGFDGSSIEGLTRVYEADMIAKPDPTTFQVLPWRGERHGTARMFCDILTPEGEPSLADSRNVLKRALARASEKGFTFYTHPEVEFYLFDAPATSTTCRAAPRTTSGAPRSPCWSPWASRWSSPTTRPARARTRSTCGTPTP
jgi:glutamine synthetase